jgi:hypothetical protein
MSGKDEPTRGDVLRAIVDLGDRMDRLDRTSWLHDTQVAELIANSAW